MFCFSTIFQMFCFNIWHCCMIVIITFDICCFNLCHSFYSDFFSWVPSYFLNKVIWICIFFVVLFYVFSQRIFFFFLTSLKIVSCHTASKRAHRFESPRLCAHCQGKHLLHLLFIAKKKTCIRAGMLAFPFFWDWWFLMSQKSRQKCCLHFPLHTWHFSAFIVALHFFKDPISSCLPLFSPGSTALWRGSRSPSRGPSWSPSPSWPSLWCKYCPTRPLEERGHPSFEPVSKPVSPVFFFNTWNYVVSVFIYLFIVFLDLYFWFFTHQIAVFSFASMVSMGWVSVVQQEARAGRLAAALPTLADPKPVTRWTPPPKKLFVGYLKDCHSVGREGLNY